MESKIKEIQKNFLADLSKEHNPIRLRIKYLGRKSELSLLLRSLKNLPIRDRKAVGRLANNLRREIMQKIDEVSRTSEKGKLEGLIDVTLPGKKPEFGYLHIISKVEQELRQIFKQLGYVCLEGPELETDYYNFEALNIPPGHPARDMHDTFYLDDVHFSQKAKKQSYLLRTHISPMQIRIMEKHQPPLAVISSGRVFRREATDARHEHTWDYMEGFAVSERLGLSDLRFTLDYVLKHFFGKDVQTKLHPSFFPFVEPGVEVAMSCIFCHGSGCKVCSTGWLEMLGAGMIHPNLFKVARYPEGKYTGFAFGLGLSRFAMMKYNIWDIRLLYKNDLRYIKQS